MFIPWNLTKNIVKIQFHRKTTVSPFGELITVDGIDFLGFGTG